MSDSKNLKHKVYQVLKKEEVCTYATLQHSVSSLHLHLYRLRQMRRFHTEKDININDEDLEFIVQQVTRGIDCHHYRGDKESCFVFDESHSAGVAVSMRSIQSSIRRPRVPHPHSLGSRPATHALQPGATHAERGAQTGRTWTACLPSRDHYQDQQSAAVGSEGVRPELGHFGSHR